MVLKHIFNICIKVGTYKNNSAYSSQIIRPLWSPLILTFLWFTTFMSVRFSSNLFNSWEHHLIFNTHFWAHSSAQFSHSVVSDSLRPHGLHASMPGFPVHHQLPELAQTNVHRVGDAIQPSYPLSPSPLAFNLSQQQGLFQWISSSHQVAEVLELQLQHQSFQWIFRTDFL